MSETTGMSLADFYPAWIGLQNTKIRKLVLSKMKIFQYGIDEIVRLNETFFADFKLPHLVSLQMDHTVICLVKYDPIKVFAGTPNLQVLNMSHNCLSVDVIYNLFYRLQYSLNLLNIDISHQTGPALDYDWTPNLPLPPNLTELDLSYIKQTYNCAPLHITLEKPTKLNYFNFQGNSGCELKEFIFDKPDASVKFVADFLATAWFPSQVRSI